LSVRKDVWKATSSGCSPSIIRNDSGFMERHGGRE
jgi:hypothetical protein